VHDAQGALAEAVGVEDPTLTYHLNKMETAGLVTRRRDPDNRRVHQVELTEAGERAFFTLLEKVLAFDDRLRRGATDRDLAELRRLLDRLATNVATADHNHQVEPDESR
jgi:MarR family transcriptional regulator, transcriptional regulator for hemolysin